MFQVNTLFLQKFGWKYSIWNKITYIYVESNRVFGILEEDDKVYFLRSIEKDIDDYKYTSLHSVLVDPSNVENKIEITSNAELVKTIKKYDACSKDYQRHFKLSSILNNK